MNKDPWSSISQMSQDKDTQKCTSESVSTMRVQRRQHSHLKQWHGGQSEGLPCGRHRENCTAHGGARTRQDSSKGEASREGAVNLAQAARGLIAL